MSLRITSLESGVEKGFECGSCWYCVSIKSTFRLYAFDESITKLYTGILSDEWIII